MWKQGSVPLVLTCRRNIQRIWRQSWEEHNLDSSILKKTLGSKANYIRTIKLNTNGREGVSRVLHYICWPRCQHRRRKLQTQSQPNLHGVGQPIQWGCRWGCKCSPSTIPGNLQHFVHWRSQSRYHLILSISLFPLGEGETVVLC